jgi:Flp pilus assembly protein TadG
MKKVKSERGQSLVELSISLVIVLYLLSGMVEFGIAFFQFIQLRDAAQDGALYASIKPFDTTGIVARVRNASSSPLNLADTTAVTVTVSAAPSPCAANGTNAMTVTASYNHRIFMPFLPRLIGTNIIALSAPVTDTILQC